jgi:excisionase family DNA binding protein
MTTKEISEYLKLNVAMVQKYASEGKIPAVKVGNVWRFEKDTIDKWLTEGGKGKPGTQKPIKRKSGRKPKKKQKPTVIDKAIILLKDIRKNGPGRTLFLSRKYKFNKTSVSRILITLKNQGLLDKNADGTFSIADEWR